MPSPARAPWRILATLAVAGFVLAGCSPTPRLGTSTRTWYAARTLPAFDPDGPPDALRWALERHLSRGLLERDTTGRVVPGLADSLGCSPDSLAWTFRLAPGLRYTDGTPVTSADLRAALVAGLAREDHATREWLLGAVGGVAFVRAGRPLPALAIETPDPRRLRLRLAARDPRLLEKLATPGVATPWKRRRGAWTSAVGVGPFRVLPDGDDRTLTLVAAGPVAGVAAAVDTLRVRLGGAPARARGIARLGLADVAWPVPQAFLDAPRPGDWRLERARAEPARELLLVLRSDVPPLTRLQARRDLAHAVNREELVSALGPRGEPLRRWPGGATADFPWPRLETALDRLARGELQARAAQGGTPSFRTSHHLVLAFDQELSGAAVAPVLQAQWERAGHYVDLKPLRGSAAAAEALSAAAAPVQLVEAQPLAGGTAAEGALWRMPPRGPAVGAFRTGWRAPLPPGRSGSQAAPDGLDADALQALAVAERVVLPLARLPWLVGVREGIEPPALHPAYGPHWTRPEAGRPSRGSR
jgi:ABC-type transport system substrate-binding protein